MALTKYVASRSLPLLLQVCFLSLWTWWWSSLALHLRRKGLVSCLYTTCQPGVQRQSNRYACYVISSATAPRATFLQPHIAILNANVYGTCQPRVNHIHYPLHKRYQILHNWPPLLCNSWNKSRIGMTPDPSSSSEGCGPPD